MFQRFCIFALMGAQWANKDHVKAFALLLDRDAATPPVEVQPEAVGGGFVVSTPSVEKVGQLFLRQLANAFWALLAHDLAYCSSKKRFLSFSLDCRHPSGVWHKLDGTPTNGRGVLPAPQEQRRRGAG